MVSLYAGHRNPLIAFRFIPDRAVKALFDTYL